jgi:hypothetical protein
MLGHEGSLTGRMTKKYRIGQKCSRVQTEGRLGGFSGKVFR